MAQYPAFLVLLIGISLAPARADMIDTTGLQPWETCALCHGLDGVSQMAKFPKLAGQSYQYLVKQLVDFRSNRRTNDGGMMVSNAELLTPASLRAVARYFSELEPPPSTSAPRNAAGAKLFLQGKPSADLPACVSCHRPNTPDYVNAPHLEGQHAAYVAKQLHDFQSETRSNATIQVMRRIAQKLSKTDISAVAEFVAGLQREKRKN